MADKRWRAGSRHLTVPHVARSTVAPHTTKPVPFPLVRVFRPHPLQREGHGFKSRQLHHLPLTPIRVKNRGARLMPRPRTCIIGFDHPALPGQSRCAKHSRGWRKSPVMQARSSYHDTPQWRARRKRQLEAEPNCRQCGARASIADHIDPIGLGGDPDGPLQSLCLRCHNRKTAGEGVGRRRRSESNRADRERRRCPSSRSSEPSPE